MKKKYKTKNIKILLNKIEEEEKNKKGDDGTNLASSDLPNRDSRIFRKRDNNRN